MSTLRNNVLLFLVGAVVISAGDRVHITFDILSQPDKTLWGQAWWVPLVFGLAGVVIVAGYSVLRRLLEVAPNGAGWGKVLLSAAIFLAAYAATGPWGDYKIALTIALPALWVARVVPRRNVAAVVLSVVLAFAGPFHEYLFSVAGLFSYHDPDVMHVPIWLPGIYLHGALVAVDVDGLLEQYRA